MEVKIVEKSAFEVTGRKCFITGQDNSQFADFWAEMHSDGSVEKIKSNSKKISETVTQSCIIGVSRVENDPNNRAFDFYIASEGGAMEGFESFEVGANTWAVFRNVGDDPTMTLVKAEMYCFMEWLPASAYKHAMAPEMEVYPADDDNAVEFWLPIVKK